MPKTLQSSKDYEELGKMVAAIHDSGYLDHKEAYKTSFIKGVLGGLGGVIGATLLLGVLLWVLTLFHNVPLISRVTENVKNTINSEKK